MGKNLYRNTPHEYAFIGYTYANFQRDAVKYYRLTMLIMAAKFNIIFHHTIHNVFQCKITTLLTANIH